MALPDFTVDRNSTKYVLGSGGDIISYATDEPAIEFNTDGSFKGLLVEPTATNICRQSEDFSTSWSNSNSTETTNATTAPDGNTTADKIIPDNAVAFGGTFIYQPISPITASSTFTASVFAKAAGFDQVQIFCDDGVGVANRAEAKYSLTDGSYVSSNGVGTFGFVSSSAQDYGNGWYRISLTFTNSATAATRFRIYVHDSVASTGNGTDGIFVWGAQLEESPIATSYIPTTTASVTRVKDDITQTSASSLIGQSEGTLYIEVDWKEASGTFQYLLTVSDGTLTNRIFIFNISIGQLRMAAVADGTVLTDQGESYSTYSGIQKIAFAYKTNDFELYRNGSSISSDTSGSLAALGTLTDIDLGQAFNATAQANMHIRAVALYKERLSDAQCIALTS